MNVLLPEYIVKNVVNFMYLNKKIVLVFVIVIKQLHFSRSETVFSMCTDHDTQKTIKVFFVNLMPFKIS